MKLWYAPTSPFARKVRIALRELGLEGTVEEIAIDPWTDPGLRARNPLAKVPTFETDDGEILFESSLICEFLNARAGGGLFPAQPGARWPALRLLAIADGVAGATGRLFADTRRPETERSAAVMVRQDAAIEAGLDALEARAGELSAGLSTIGAIAAASAADYVGFRFPDRDWRSARPALAEWCAAVGSRPSMAATRFRLPG